MESLPGSNIGKTTLNYEKYSSVRPVDHTPMQHQSTVSSKEIIPVCASSALCQTNHIKNTQ